MKITNHLLVADGGEKIKIDLSPFAGATIDPVFLIIHYTATDNASSPISWFKDKKGNTARIAAHIVLAKDGTITQMIPFNKKANHAGSSNWDGINGMNTYGIGIEIVNEGRVSKAFPAGTKPVVHINHKDNPAGTALNEYWFSYPQVQLDALILGQGDFNCLP
jgi:N-acetylmuramoyl-L-alanine amidase